ncbi:MAG: 50S ribosomal protein L22 [Candidatus Paceibacterota bacterium]
MKAFLKNYRQSPRKVRLVAGLIKGKNVDQAVAELDFLAKRAGLPIKKLLLSAVANAKNMGVDQENLFIQELRVDKGITMKRMMPAAMGTGHRINKRTSHLNLVLGERLVKAKEAKKEKKSINPKTETKIGKLKSVKALGRSTAGEAKKVTK